MRITKIKKKQTIYTYIKFINLSQLLKIIFTEQNQDTLNSSIFRLMVDKNLLLRYKNKNHLFFFHPNIFFKLNKLINNKINKQYNIRFKQIKIYF